MGKKARQSWKDERMEDRNRAQKFKKKDTDRNHCDQCGHMMCNYDLHPRCVACRGSDCNGSDISCHICYSWPDYQKRALQWAKKYAHNIARGKNKNENQAHKTSSSYKYATSSGQKNPEPRLKQVSSRMSNPETSTTRPVQVHPHGDKDHATGPVSEAIGDPDKVLTTGEHKQDQELVQVNITEDTEGEASSENILTNDIHPDASDKMAEQAAMSKKELDIPADLSMRQLYTMHQDLLKRFQETDLLQRVQEMEEKSMEPAPQKQPPDFRDQEAIDQGAVEPDSMTFKTPNKVTAKAKPKPQKEPSPPLEDESEEEEYNYDEEPSTEDIEMSHDYTEEYDQDDFEYRHRSRYRSRSRPHATATLRETDVTVGTTTRIVVTVETTTKTTTPIMMSTTNTKEGAVINAAPDRASVQVPLQHLTLYKPNLIY